MFYPVIQDYLKGEIEIDEVSKKLFSPIDEKISESRLDDVNFLDLWYSVIHSARRISFRERDWHAKVADVVAAFKNYSIPGNEQYNYLYSALTDFSMACREAYNDTPAPESSFDIEIRAWANMNYFYASVAGKGLDDLSLFAIWTMRQALETPQEDDKQSTAAQKYKTYVPAAAVWVFGMRIALYAKEEDLTPKDKKLGNPARGGALWKGKAEFSTDRWRFWRERFAEVGKLEDVSEDTQTLAKDAVEAMERAATFEKVTD